MWWSKPKAKVDKVTEREAVLAHRVQRGATVLDQMMPSWYTRVRPSALNMHSATHCVLGQSMGWENGSDRFHMWGLSVVNHGFVPMRVDDGVMLKALWTQQIHARQQAADERQERLLVRVLSVKRLPVATPPSDEELSALIDSETSSVH